MERRSFLKNSMFVSAMMAAGGRMPLVAEAQPKRILVLGGTSFLGPAFVEAALADGRTVSLFNRGVKNPELFPYVEKLRGFRSANPDDQNLSALGKRHWDAVIDVWPNDPALAESAAQLLRDRTKHYLYVSSIGAYDSKDFTQPNLTEDAPICKWDGPENSYCRGKAESERRLHAIVGEKLTIVRPGPIKGVRDTTPDLLGWLRRLQSAKTVIAPGNGTNSVEIVDVKDVADFLVLAMDHSIFGTFNLTGRAMSFRDFLMGVNPPRTLMQSWSGFQNSFYASKDSLPRIWRIGFYPFLTGIRNHRAGISPESVARRHLTQDGRPGRYVTLQSTIWNIYLL